MEAWQQSVYAFVLRALAHEADAADLSQEILLTLYRKRSQIKDPASERAWVYKVARNAIARHWRTRQRAAKHLAVLAPPLPPPDSARVVEGRDLAEALLRHTAALPDEEREVIELLYFERLSQVEAAQVLSVARNTVNARLNRGIGLLRARLGVAGRTAILVELGHIALPKAPPVPEALVKSVRALCAPRSLLVSAASLGGSLMKTKALIGSVALIAALALGAVLLEGSGPDRPRRGQTPKAERAALALPDRGPASPTSQQPDRSKPTAPAEPLPAKPLPAPASLPGAASVEGEEKPDRLAYSGRLVDGDGAPVPGAVVALTDGVQSFAPSTIRDRAVSDGEGRFRVSGPRSCHGLEITAPPDLLDQVWGLNGDSEGEVELGDLRLEPARVIRGRVVSPTGEPVPDACVLLYEKTSGHRVFFGEPEPGALRQALDSNRRVIRGEKVFYSGEPLSAVFSGRGGLFEIKAPQGACRAVAEHASYFSSNKVDCDPSRPAEELELALRAAFDLEVRVQDKEGRALPGASVTIQHYSRGTWCYGAVQPLDGEEQTDREGRARFSGLLRDRYKLVVDLAGFGAFKRDLKLYATQKSKVFTVTLGAAACIRGRVVFARPFMKAGDIHRVKVKVLPGAEIADKESFYVYPQEDGRFTFDQARPGPYRLFIEAKGHRSLTLSIRYPEGGSELDLGDLALEEARDWTITVLEANGAPALGVNVICEPWDLPFTTNTRETTDERGVAVIPAPPPGRVRVVINKDADLLGFYDLTVPKDPQGQVLRLPSSYGALSARVLGLPTGNSQMLSISLRDPRQRMSQEPAPFFAEGNRFEIRGVPPGRYQVVLDLGGPWIENLDGSSSRPERVLGEVEIKGGETSAKEFQVPAQQKGPQIKSSGPPR